MTDRENTVGTERRIEKQLEYEDEQGELDLKIKLQYELCESTRKKKAEVEANIKKLDSFIKQSLEESLMTDEDITGKCMKKAELVALREELDQMYDIGKNSAGQEFHLFLKLQEVTTAAGTNSSKFIQQEYDQIKAFTFFNDIANQMKSIVSG